MNEDELERRLAAAFDARARAGVPDDRTPPALRLDGAHGLASPTSPTSHRRVAPQRRRTVRWLAPVAAAAAVLVVVAGAIALSSGPQHPRHVAFGASNSASQTGSRPAAAAQSGSQASSHTVHISSPIIGDGSRVGVGMPIIIDFSKAIGDARTFAAMARVTVNGRAVSGAWYFEHGSSQAAPVVAHWRMRDFWPAHAKIHLDLPVRGQSAGNGLSFGNDLTLDYSTGAANVVTVREKTHRLTLLTDGRTTSVSMPVSLGAKATPTHRGTKVIMNKDGHVCMSGPSYNECNVPYTMQLTNDGEYVSAASWNANHIKRGIDSSDGCTNLLTGDAATLFRLLSPGDVVEFPDANGPAMGAGDGIGDWNVAWSTWVRGGLYATK